MCLFVCSESEIPNLVGPIFDPSKVEIGLYIEYLEKEHIQVVYSYIRLMLLGLGGRY